MVWSRLDRPHPGQEDSTSSSEEDDDVAHQLASAADAVGLDGLDGVPARVVDLINNGPFGAICHRADAVSAGSPQSSDAADLAATRVARTAWEARCALVHFVCVCVCVLVC